MASATGISGTAVAVATLGAVLVYAGFRGVSPLQALRDAAGGSPPPVVGNPTAAPTITGTTPQLSSGFAAGGVGLLAEMKRIGAGRKYSQLRRTGPESYDCSGLVWRAGANLGLWGPGTKWFKDPFSTASFIVHTSEIGLTRKGSAILPEAGDIIWWVGHMGVAESSTRFYSAMTTKAGIGSAPIASLDKSHGPHQCFYYANAPGVGAGSGGGGGGSW